MVLSGTMGEIRLEAGDMSVSFPGKARLDGPVPPKSVRRARGRT